MTFIFIGETSLAYEEIFTITLVTGRTVGIGAYLVRLGQRVVQVKKILKIDQPQQTRAPIILTGAAALNKVLGRKVYSSNSQLGGTQVMFTNGVSHLIAHDDLEGICDIVNWLSFVPAKKNGSFLNFYGVMELDRLPVIDPIDPVDRIIEFAPSKQPYDPRHMLAGKNSSQSSCNLPGTLDSNNKWISGFFDKGTFIESLSGWAKTVITGRARLGGIPMGVIAVETRTIEQIKPADPAVDESQENIQMRVSFYVVGRF